MAKQVISIRVDPADLAIIDAKAKAAGKDRTTYMVARALDRRFGGASLGRVDDEPCRHPLNRRIGDGCGVCGKSVKGTKP